jgi:hypothetical protein
VDETRVPGENHRPVARHWQTLWSTKVVSSSVSINTTYFVFMQSCNVYAVDNCAISSVLLQLKRTCSIQHRHGQIHLHKYHLMNVPRSYFIDWLVFNANFSSISAYCGMNKFYINLDNTSFFLKKLHMYMNDKQLQGCKKIYIGMKSTCKVVNLSLNQGHLVTDKLILESLMISIPLVGTFPPFFCYLGV